MMRISRKRRSAIPRVTLQGRHVTDVIDKFNRPIGRQEVLFDVEDCTIQPFTGDQFLIKQEGFQDKSAFTVFTSTKLSEGVEGTINKPDEINIYGDWYRVVKVKPWQVNLVPHYEVVCVKLDEGLV